MSGGSGDPHDARPEEGASAPGVCATSPWSWVSRSTTGTGRGATCPCPSGPFAVCCTASAWMCRHRSRRRTRWWSCGCDLGGGCCRHASWRGPDKRPPSRCTCPTARRSPSRCSPRTARRPGSSARSIAGWSRSWSTRRSWGGNLRRARGPALGYHVLRAVGAATSAPRRSIVTPAWLGLPERLGGERVWGLMTQLYSLRSRKSWGVGDLGDLADLAVWARRAAGRRVRARQPAARRRAGGSAGAVALPADHPAVRQPALPAGRGIPEYAALTPSRAAAVETLAAPLRLRYTSTCSTATPRGPQSVTALELVARVPLHRRPAGRLRRLSSAAGSRAGRLRDLVRPRGDVRPDRRNPGRARRAPAAKRSRPSVSDWPTRSTVDPWLQWWLDEQLARRRPRRPAAGMPLGVMHDLAVGVHPEGADAWALRDVLARGCTVGAPPDAFNQIGQDWSQPPWRPDALAEAGYAPFRDMVRDGAAARGRAPGRPHHRAVPAVVGAGGAARDRGRVRALRPRGAGRDPRAGGAAGPRRRDR